MEDFAKRLVHLGVLAAIVLAATWWQPAPVAAAPALQSSACAVAVATAIAQRGKPYVWGAAGPDAFDCSGLTSYSWRSAGYSIGRSTYDQATAGVSIPCRMENLSGANTTCWQPGDLIFLRYSGGQHVAMYIKDGLFADAYNRDTGVIIHAVEYDSYYWDHFWQARRIVDCGDLVPITAPSADLVPSSLPPSLEEIPDIIAPVAFTVQQCGECNADGSVILPPTQWSGSWPVGFEALNLPLVFQTVISWLAWQVSEIARQIICWLLSMLARLGAFLAAAANMLIYGVNSLFKISVFAWLAARAQFLALWLLLEDMRQLLATLGNGFAGLAEFGRLILEVAALIGSLIARLLALLGDLAISVLGVVGWLGGLVIGFWFELQLAFTGTSVPAQLGTTHVIYRATRGTLEGVRDSEIGWVFYLLWAMAYVAFVTWLARFLSASRAGAE